MKKASLLLTLILLPVCFSCNKSNHDYSALEYVPTDIILKNKE